MRTSNSVWVDEPDGHKVVLSVEITPVGHSKRLVCDRVLDWTPYVDDAYTSFEETVRILSEVTVHTRNTGIECLVDVNALDGATVELADSCLIARLASV